MSDDPRPGYTRLPRNLGIRVGLLLGVTLVIAIGFVLYVLYARGVFEATQRLTLVAEDAEGVSVGMDLTFSGFPIGRGQRLRRRHRKALRGGRRQSRRRRYR